MRSLPYLRCLLSATNFPFFHHSIVGWGKHSTSHSSVTLLPLVAVISARGRIIRGTLDTLSADGDMRSEPLLTLLGVERRVARGLPIGFSKM